MAILDIFHTQKPIAEINIHLNYLYMRLDQNFNCPSISASDFTGIAFYIMSYGEKPDGSIDETNQIDRFSYILNKEQLNYLHKEDNLPDFNYKIYVENYWLKISFAYIFGYLTPGAANYYPSGTIDFLVDNRIPLINSKTTTKYVKNKLRDNLLNNITPVYFLNRRVQDEPLTNFKVWDVFINRDGASSTQIKEKTDTGFQIQLIDKEYRELVDYLISNQAIAQIFYKKYGEFAPLSIIEEFHLILNKVKYRIFLTGDINFIIQKYKGWVGNNG